jgi:hypothetical protein
VNQRPPDRRAGAAPAPQRRSDVASGGRRHQRDADPPDDRLGEIGQDRGALGEVAGSQQRRQFGEGGGHRQAERAGGPGGEAVQRLTAVRPPEPRHRDWQQHEQLADRRDGYRGREHAAVSQRRREPGDQRVGDHRPDQERPDDPERRPGHEDDHRRDGEARFPRDDLIQVDQEQQRDARALTAITGAVSPATARPTSSTTMRPNATR